MKCETTTHTRYLLVSDIPKVSADGSNIPLRELELDIRYRTGEERVGGALAGITLDHAIIPRIVEALNDEPSKTCKTCTYWHRQSVCDFVNKSVADPGTKRFELEITVTDADDQGYLATGPDFGCVHHQLKE